MAKSLQYSQATLIARISTTRTTDDEPIPDTARSSRTNAIISQSRWYKISVRPGHRAIAQSELRLEVENKFVFGKCATEFAVELTSGLSFCAKCRHKKAIRTTSGDFGVIKREIGTRNQIIDIRTICWSNGNTGACADKHVLLVDFKSFSKSLQ